MDRNAVLPRSNESALKTMKTKTTMTSAPAAGLASRRCASEVCRNRSGAGAGRRLRSPPSMPPKVDGGAKPRLDPSGMASAGRRR